MKYCDKNPKDTQQRPNQYKNVRNKTMQRQTYHHWAGVKHYCYHFFLFQVPLRLAQLVALLQISDDPAMPHVLRLACSTLHNNLPLLRRCRNKVVIGRGELQVEPCFRAVLCFHSVEELGVRRTCNARWSCSDLDLGRAAENSWVKSSSR